jgi:hypothetical protein
MGMLSKKTAWAAIALAAALLLAQFWLRPLWRDEYWALYFSAPHDPLWRTLTETMTRDVHPPLYFTVLHFWRQISDAEIFARFFNVLVLALGAWGAWSLRGTTRPAETGTYVFLCATSFWLVFYAAEVRMMGALFVLSGLTVLVVRNAFDEGRVLMPALLFFAIGLVEASSHFFGTLWIAALGLATGLTFLAQRRLGGFLAFGLASAMAILPAVAWIALVRPDTNPGATPELPPFWDNFSYGANQFLRGLVVKTMVANLFAFIAAGLGLRMLLRRGFDPALAAIGGGALLTVIIAFGVHLFWVSLIKERAFIVMIPAFLYLAAAAIEAIGPDQKRARWLAGAAPAAALVFLPLFSSELFKDRERIGPLRELIAANPTCRGEPVVAYPQPSAQAEDFPIFFTRSALAGLGVEIVPFEGQAPIATSCPIKVVAVGMGKGERETHEAMRAKLSAAGYDLSALEEKSMGGGRTRAFVAPAAP